jgi:hypothetical protein
MRKLLSSVVVNIYANPFDVEQDAQGKHSHKEHSAPTPTHMHIKRTCIYITATEQQFPQ